MNITMTRNFSASKPNRYFEQPTVDLDNKASITMKDDRLFRLRVANLTLHQMVVPVLLLLLTLSVHAASVTVQADSGALGSEWTVNQASLPASITINTDNTGNNPGSSNRVATYTVTFPAAGTYQLYARVWVDSGGANSDSLFYGSKFGALNPTNNSDWVLVNGLANAGYNIGTNVVTNSVGGGGSVGTLSWKWINLSQFTGQAGFTVSAGNLTQTFQIGGRENGLSLEQFVFSTSTGLTVAELGGSDNACYIDASLAQQVIDGFGFSDGWSGTLSSAKNNALYQTLGFSIFRAFINTNSGKYATPVANIQAAHAAGATVFATAWCPVGWSSPTTNHCLPVYYPDYANWLNAQAVSKNIDYISPFNEPDGGTNDIRWTPTEILNFIKTNAPAIGKPILMPESIGFNNAYSDSVLNDSIAVSNIIIVAGHFYGNGNYVHTNALTKGKHVWETEHVIPDSATNLTQALVLAKEVSDAMNNQFSAYCWWWVNDNVTDGSDLVLSDGTIFMNGYVLGQFARWVRPGMLRCATTYNPTNGVYVTAYNGTNGLVLVAINTNTAAATQYFSVLNVTNVNIFRPYRTSADESLTVLTPVNVTNNAFTCALPPESVTTFVQFLGSLPNAPEGLNVTLQSSSQPSLTWNAVTNATSYNVKRSLTNGGPYTIVATGVTATNFSDTVYFPQTTFYYVVSAVNDGGESPDSLQVGITTLASVSVEPVADAYVENGGNANVNYGTSTNLWVKNNVTSGSPLRNAYLLFDVRALSNIQSATLTLMPSRVDSSSVPMYYGLAPTNWSETGISWNNQPANSGIYFATNTVSTLVPVVLDVTSAVRSQATNGGLLSICISQPTNSLNGLIQFCSKEHPTNAWHPLLTWQLPANTPPVLPAISSRTIGAGISLSVTNSATDSDVPAQTLTYSLATAPTNAVINTNSGVLTWRPLVTQANSTNPFTVIVADNGTPSLSATQSFSVIVSPLAQPVLSAPSLSSGQFALQANGDSGPDYQIQTSTNLVDWNVVLTTNSPAMPFNWTTETTNGPLNFFRIQAGPPWP